MKRFLLCATVLSLIALQCQLPHPEHQKTAALNRTAPRVLIITSGISDKNARFAQGIIIAIQSCNKKGVPVRLEPRDILYNYNKLSTYTMVVLSTFPGYHDADRNNSLSYMSDEELQNLAKFVHEGGIIIACDNVGRNFPDGTDRIKQFNALTPANWELAKCLGFSLVEKNMTGYGFAGDIPGGAAWDIPASQLSNADDELWILVPDSLVPGDQTEVYAHWENEHDTIPGIVQTTYGKGTTFWLASSALLQPDNDGGFWSEAQINLFYAFVIDHYKRKNNLPFDLNPWPKGYDYAFCASFNAAGSLAEYERVVNVLKSYTITPTFFVNGMVTKEIQTFLQGNDCTLASSGYTYNNYERLKYPQALEDMLRNNVHWGMTFSGFRFPFTKPGYWGLLALDEYNYSYESSIGANNIDFFHGSVVPYNIVITSDGYYKSTNILEIAPTYHDDYFFLNAIKTERIPEPMVLDKNIHIYTKYLDNYWERAVKPYNGVMVYLGHPQFVGYNDTTVSALQMIVNKVKQDNTWITTLNDVAQFRMNLSMLRIVVDNNDRKCHITIHSPEHIYIKQVCLNFAGRHVSSKAKKGPVQVMTNQSGSQVIFDAFNGQELSVSYSK